MHFVLCGEKTQVISNWSNLFLSHMLVVVSVMGGGYYTLLKFLQHFSFTQLQIPRVMPGRMVSMVLKHERIPRNGCVSVRKSTRHWSLVSLLIRRQVLP